MSKPVPYAVTICVGVIDANAVFQAAMTKARDQGVAESDARREFEFSDDGVDIDACLRFLLTPKDSDVAGIEVYGASVEG